MHMKFIPFPLSSKKNSRMVGKEKGEGIGKEKKSKE